MCLRFGYTLEGIKRKTRSLYAWPVHSIDVVRFFDVSPTCLFAVSVNNPLNERIEVVASFETPLF